MGCEVLYGPQILRISAHLRLYCWRNLAATRTSSSISSVVMPSLISDSGSARRLRAAAAIDAAASSSRRVIIAVIVAPLAGTRRTRLIEFEHVEVEPVGRQQRSVLRHEVRPRVESRTGDGGAQIKKKLAGAAIDRRKLAECQSQPDSLFQRNGAPGRNAFLTK